MAYIITRGEGSMARHIRGVVMLVALAGTIVPGCDNKSHGRSSLGSKVGDREVTATTDGAASITSKEATVTITFLGGRLDIEKGAVNLDGRELTTLPEGTKRVDVDYTARKLTITAEGKVVFEKELRK